MTPDRRTVTEGDGMAVRLATFAQDARLWCFRCHPASEPEARATDKRRGIWGHS